MTRVTDGHVPDDVYEDTIKQFSEEEVIDLTVAITTINAWKRLNIALRTEAGTYRAPSLTARAAR